MIFDYESLRIIFWALLFSSVLGFVLTEGLNLGMGMLLGLLDKTSLETEHNTNYSDSKCYLLALQKPKALQNLVWLFVSLALLFAAWPIAYAVLLSSLPWLLTLLLLGWLIRPLGYSYRDASLNPHWQLYWDKALSISSFLSTVILGLIAGNLLKGIPFHLDSDMRIFFLGDVWGLLNAFSLLVAAVSLSLFGFYAATYVQLKIKTPQLFSAWAIKAGSAFVGLYALAGLWLTRLEGYHISSDIFTQIDSNPLNKFVKRSEGLWLDNYEHIPALWIIPLLVFLSTAVSLYCSKQQLYRWAFRAALASVFSTVTSVAISLFPFIVPSNRSLNSSLTLWDASASYLSLSALIWVAVPAVLVLALLSAWVYRVKD
jgi:cytochrome d ubiquinol oxidase subunit II